MCLGEVAQVVRLGPASSALVRSAQRTTTVSLVTLDDVDLDGTGDGDSNGIRPGDWLVCHSGFALRRLTAAQATEATDMRATTAAPRKDPS